MNYKVDLNKLIVNEEVVYEAPGEICDTLAGIFNEESLLLIYDAYHLVPNKDMPSIYRKADDPKLQEAINQNVLCLDKEGNILWRIEPSGDRPVDHIRFIKNRPGLEGLWVYRRDAEEYKIDPSSGKILDWQMGL